jgi:prepilin-type N-terminal cleavage/methylation domain-containing protein
MMKARQGFTLVELLMVVLIGSVLMSAAFKVMSVQEATNRQQQAIVGVEQNLRMALAVLTNDLRETSATGGDIINADSISIRYRVLRKAGVICTRDYGGNPAWMIVGTFGQAFAANDSIAFFVEGANKTTSLDDTTRISRISSTQAGTCTGNPIGNVLRINVPNGAAVSTDTGGLVRSFVDAGYRLVNAGSKASLFRIESPDSVAIVDSLLTVASGGLRLRYYDASGTQITPSTAALRKTIMRIEVKVGASMVGGQTGARRLFTDSLKAQVFLRGNTKTS